MSDTLFISIFILLFLSVVFGYRILENRVSYQAAEKLRIVQALVFLGLFAYHGIQTLGPLPFFLLLLLGFVVSFIIEYLGVNHGWIFGRYHYTDAACPLPNPGGVPLCYPLAWSGLIYAGFWTILLWNSPTGEHITLSWAVIFSTAAIVTVIDFILDPVAVDEDRWIWHHPGKYYGIPWTNFAGWFLTVVIILTIFRLVKGPILAVNFPTRLSSIYPGLGFALLALVSIRPCLERKLYLPAIIGLLSGVTILFKILLVILK